MLSKRLNIRLSPKQLVWVKKNARINKQTEAEYVRSLVDKEIEKAAKARKN